MPVPALLDHLESMRERRALRRVAAILFHRRAGFSANGMGVGRCRTSGSSSWARGWRRSAGSRTATSGPTYADWPYSVFTMAHGRSKEECDAILDSIAADTGIEDRRTLYSSTEFKKIRLLYFTGAHREWERVRPSSAERYAPRAAVELLPGRGELARRAMRSIGRDPIFVARGEGAELIDVDGNRYVDWVMSWGPLIAGHAHPEVVAASAAAAAGRASARPPRRRSTGGRGGRARPSAEMVR